MLYFLKKDFKKVLTGLGIVPGDDLFIHSSLASLGKTENINDVFESFFEVIDYRGTIVFPTYSFSSWPKEHFFNPETTKAETGILPNLFLKLPGVRRTIQGNHSLAIWGDKKAQVAIDWAETSFGHESAIYKTVALNFKNIMIGTPYSSGCSIFHCIEQELEVPYRFYKNFPGVVQTGSTKREYDFKMFVRNLDVKVDLEKVAPLFENQHFIKFQKYNYGTITTFNLEPAYNLVKKTIKKNPYFLI